MKPQHLFPDPVALAMALIAAACVPHPAALAAETVPIYATAPGGTVLIPGGRFDMGDHHGFVDPKHGGDEGPVHTVQLDPFHMGVNPVTTAEYCEFLNSTLGEQRIEVRQGGVYLAGSGELLAETRERSPYSRIGWNGEGFAVLDRRERHPVVCIRWEGAAAYCNWLGSRSGRPPCYDLATWDCDFNKSGFRLPTEAEWEYAARGGLHDPYRIFPWGDEADATRANWPESRNPFRAGPPPWTTPVGFFDGQLKRRAEFAWPGREETFQTSRGVNGYGLNDMTGNVWQFVNDWYGRDYYSYSPARNPPGPAQGSGMPDGKPYRGMRGGSWYNGENGHGRVANRNPSYFRGPEDPDHPYYHLGFRVVVPVHAEVRPVVKPTPTAAARGREGASDGGGRRSRPGGGGGRREERAPRTEGMSGADRAATPRTGMPTNTFVLRSAAVEDRGALPAEFTGDGASATLPLEWTGAPAETRSYALIMHHEAPDQTKWYWILYNLPAETRSLPKNTRGLGTLGSNSVNRRAEYAPPHSKGPGAKTYTYTLYALSSPLELALTPAEVTRDTLLAAMQGRILASAALEVTYTRPEGAAGRDEPPGDRPPRDASRAPGRPRPPTQP